MSCQHIKVIYINVYKKKVEKDKTNEAHKRIEENRPKKKGTPA
jgi:hypothetical protein